MPQIQQFTPADEVIRTPTKIGSLKISFVRGYNELIPELHGGDPTEIKNKALYDDLSVLDQNGDIMDWKRGDLLPHLTDQEIQGLMNLLDRLWALAEEQILP